MIGANELIEHGKKYCMVVKRLRGGEGDNKVDYAIKCFRSPGHDGPHKSRVEFKWWDLDQYTQYPVSEGEPE